MIMVLNILLYKHNNTKKAKQDCCISVLLITMFMVDTLTRKQSIIKSHIGSKASVIPTHTLVTETYNHIPIY